jgi:hypothetical protein
VAFKSQRETLHSHTRRIVLFCHFFVGLPQFYDVLVARRDLTVSRNYSALYFFWQVFALFELLGDVTFAHSLYKRHQLVTKVVAGLPRHLCGQVVDTMKQNVVLSHLANLFFEVLSNWVVKQKWLFN